ncbi:hypothetical protein BC830DRAFT_1081025 [Chytriomyces sp. MP71]|nr:hypothetical protein BC830DRAFT_1081025 [Chytriomyces sp. MP71]
MRDLFLEEELQNDEEEKKGKKDKKDKKSKKENPDKKYKKREPFTGRVGGQGTYAQKRDNADDHNHRRPDDDNELSTISLASDNQQNRNEGISLPSCQFGGVIMTFVSATQPTTYVSETELDPLDLMSAVLDQTANMKSTHSSVARKSCLMPKNYLGPTTPDMARQRKTVKFSKEPLSRSATPELTENELSDQFELYMYSRLDQLNRLVPVRADSLPRSSSLQGQRSSMLMKIPKRTSSLNGLSCSYKGLPEEVA